MKRIISSARIADHFRVSRLLSGEMLCWSMSGDTEWRGGGGGGDAHTLSKHRCIRACITSTFVPVHEKGNINKTNITRITARAHRINPEKATEKTKQINCTRTRGSSADYKCIAFGACVMIWRRAKHSIYSIRLALCHIVLNSSGKSDEQ